MRVKVNKLSLKSVFKTVLISLAIPYIIYIIAAIILLILGVPFNTNSSIFLTLVYLMFAPLMYAIIVTLLALSYNWLAPKIGGIEIEIDDDIKNQ